MKGPASAWRQVGADSGYDQAGFRLLPVGLGFKSQDPLRETRGKLLFAEDVLSPTQCGTDGWKSYRAGQ